MKTTWIENSAARYDQAESHLLGAILGAIMAALVDEYTNAEKEQAA